MLALELPAEGALSVQVSVYGNTETCMRLCLYVALDVIHTHEYICKAGAKCYLNKTLSHFLAALLHVLERFLLPDPARGL